MTSAAVVDDQVMRGFPPPAEHRVRLDQVYAEPRLTHWYMQHARELTATAAVSARRGESVGLPEKPLPLDTVEVNDARGGRWTIAHMLRATCADAIAILDRGKLVYERYFNGMKPETAHLHQSVTKSLASCVAANLVESGTLGVDDVVGDIVPELTGSAYGDATVRHLLDMSVGIRYEDDLDKPQFEGARLCRLEGVQPRLSDDEPGSMYDFATQTHKQGEHGEVFHYVSLNTIVLGWVMERATGRRAAELLGTHVWSKLGTEHDAYVLLDAAGSAQLEGGFASSLRDLARFGQMLCQSGQFNGQQVVPAWWLEDVRHNGDRQAFAACAQSWVAARSWEGCSYRSCFWVADASDNVSFSAAGWLGQRVYVNQEAEVVVAFFSSRPPDLDDEMGAHAFRACEDLARILA
jgi:CubicO group peptidase (beta-lactamase class C family)